MLQDIEPTIYIIQALFIPKQKTKGDQSLLGHKAF